MSPTILLMQYTVALLGTLLAFGIGVHAWHERSFGVGCLALWITALAVVYWALILLMSPDGLMPPGRVLYSLMATFAAPLLLAYVTYAVRGVRLHWAWFLPFALHAGAYVVLGRYRVNELVDPVRLTMVEYCYTAVAWVVWFRYARPRSSQPAVIGVLAAVTAVHFAQGAGILDLFGVINYRPIRKAPLVFLILWLAVALAMALMSAPLFRRLVPSLTPTASDADRALFDRVEKLMRDERPWSDPDFDVGAMARMLGTYPNAVSKALSRGGSTTFYDYVNAHRIREAEP
jgi:hypothetical protein